MRNSYIFAGVGGQGVLLIGRVLSCAFAEAGKEVVMTKSYGSEMRGGCSMCAVIASDRRIGSPIIEKADAGILLSPLGFGAILRTVHSLGTLVFDESLCNQKFDLKRTCLISVPATEIAYKLGDRQLANMVIFGAFLKHTRAVSDKSVQKALEKNLPANRSALLKPNIEALSEGKKWK